MNRVQTFFEHLWQDYTVRLCPSAAKVHALLEEGQPLINDHIALRTFNLPKTGLDRLAAPFIALGYEPKGEYVFESKKLYARHFELPGTEAPKVFISELMVGQCSNELQQTVRALVDQIPDEALDDHAFLYHGRQWQLDFDTYKKLAAESEYAGWLAAHGFGANHFTVSVNQLSTFEHVVDVNNALRKAGFDINMSGGEVKGSPDVCLEQSSTMADKVDVAFTDGIHAIPGGFYEFAKRYALPSGELYHGFVEASANKIFESTDSE
ncbi:succinyldiaminopimelate aminotransferase [Veronia nyctiphanis]|uniref:2-oxoadipate dioxygenase/decarboxylase n=1 Tax=Veronia nyctiphanis TaxID=1278244 RepID=A0A4Q0YQV2_9GAMM|nr:DUF1338 domain-containing protein [Veronia nyctiphanis]RXJ73442.1 succinyldiaminopimelate aminotransferase [Veronia nyctiphanis]